jgi:phosphoribosylglycinamide formyltransferase-1
MEKLNGKKKLRVSVFISGRGTNLKSIINFSKRKSSPFKVVLIITNNKNAKGIK